MEANGVEDIKGSTVITKRVPTKSGFPVLLSAKVKETSRSLLVDKKLLKEINPSFVFII